VDVAQLGDVNAVRVLIERGADVNFADPLGRTALIYAASSDLVNLDVVKLLVEHGADVNAKDLHKQAGDFGLSVLDIPPAWRNSGGAISGQSRRQTHRRARAGSQSAPAEHHRQRHPGQPAFDSARRRKFRSQGGLRVVPRQQFRRHGGGRGP